MPDLTPLATRLEEAEASRERAVDAAVRAFRDLNPIGWPCACIGCVVTIRANFRAVLAAQSPEATPTATATVTGHGARNSVMTSRKTPAAVARSTRGTTMTTEHADPALRRIAAEMDTLARYKALGGVYSITDTHAGLFAADLAHALQRIAALEGALVDHNNLLRSAFTAAQRDAIADVVGTTNYRTLADRAHEVLTKHHAITNEARAAHVLTPEEGEP